MAKCRFKTRSGMCSVELEKGYKCTQHKDLHCSNCRKVATRQCLHPACSTYICNKPECLHGHLDSCHDGVQHKQAGGSNVAEETLDPGTQRAKGDDVTNETSICPHCDPKHSERVLKNVERKSNRAQVTCVRCGMRGPISASRTLALTNWEKLARKMLAPYTPIRTMTLEIMEHQIKIIRASSVEKNKALTNEERRSLARMAEVATTLVDIWEI